MEEDSKMEEALALPECEKEVGIPTDQEDDENDEEPSEEDEEPSEEHEDNMKEAVSSAVKEDNKMGVSSAEKVDDGEEAETPVAQVMNTHDAGNSAEKCSEEASCEKKNSEVFEVKQKFLEKSPAGNILMTRDTQGEPEDVMEEEEEVPVDQEVTKTPEAGTSAEKGSKSGSSMKKVPKVKRKIVKKSPASSLLKSNKAQGSLTVQARKREKNNKGVFQANGESSEKKIEDAGDAKKLNPMKNLENDVSKEENIEKSEEAPSSQKKISEQNEEKGGPSEKRKKNKKKRKNDNVVKVERKGNNKKQLGGMIFMCSGKTRPDCFQYRVMGVSAGKKDLVLAVKPGLKLFLYDFDLKHLYGIFKASSKGGMKLESKAFHGAFPAQVRFKVYQDCIPLPENVFKKAIKDNYYAKNKFKPELTLQQVRKLSRLFRPVGFHSSAVVVQSPPREPIRPRNVHRGVKEVRSRDPKSKRAARDYQLSREKDRKVAYRDEAPRHRGDDLYLSENEYRIYGHQLERRNLDPVPHSRLETYHRDDRDYHLRHPEPRYREVIPAHRETVHADPVYFNRKDYPVYSIDPRQELSPPRANLAGGSERYAYDPYYTRAYAHPDPYPLPSRSVERTPPTYSGRNYVRDVEPIRHAADALSYYNQKQHGRLETEVMPVSSRYSFGGPSYSYR